jgi:SAM domain (Sterile alpha motif)
VQEIGDWLEKLGMPEYGECFAQNKIDLRNRLLEAG